jgi:repressor LexA
MAKTTHKHLKPVASAETLATPLTAKEKLVMEYIESHVRQHGISPSYQEIKDHFGFASFNSVQNYLKQLVQKEYIHLAANQKRAIQILRPSQSVQNQVNKLFQHDAEKIPTQATRSPERPELLLGSREILSLPLLGKVAAGQPIEALAYNETVDVPPSMIRNPSKSFALRVQGQSMIDDGIFDGDIILVQKQSHANNGEIIVASVENEATVKRIFMNTKPNPEVLKENLSNDKLIELRPANSSMQSMWYPSQQVEIQGIVVGLIRKF